MARLWDKIKSAVEADRFVVAWHADERCELRGVSAWQLASQIHDARLLRERPASLPHPSAVVRQSLASGEEVEVVWAWLELSNRAKLVTVYFVS